MINLMINAAGTANGYALAETVNRFFAGKIRLFVGDINPPHLVAASRFADRFIQTPPIFSRGESFSGDYKRLMRNIFQKHGIDFYVPLIDADCVLFPQISGASVRSLSIPSRSVDFFSDKLAQRQMLNRQAIETESFSELKQRPCGRKNGVYKHRWGFGSKNMFTGALPAEKNVEDFFFAEKCDAPELTVDVLLHENTVYTVARERLETKDGVATKCRAHFCRASQDAAERLCAHFAMPRVFCFQTMTDKRQKRVIIDLNPRFGGGSHMSRRAGINFAANLIGLGTGLWRRPKIKKIRETFVVRFYGDSATLAE